MFKSDDQHLLKNIFCFILSCLHHRHGNLVWIWTCWAFLIQKRNCSLTWVGRVHISQTYSYWLDRLCWKGWNCLGLASRKTNPWSEMEFLTVRSDLHRVVEKDKVFQCGCRLARAILYKDFSLTSSFVVWLEVTRYVWKPASPMMDQTEKKHTIASRRLCFCQGIHRGKSCHHLKRQDASTVHSQLAYDMNWLDAAWLSNVRVKKGYLAGEFFIASIKSVSLAPERRETVQFFTPGYFDCLKRNTEAWWCGCLHFFLFSSSFWWQNIFAAFAAKF